MIYKLCNWYGTSTKVETWDGTVTKVSQGKFEHLRGSDLGELINIVKASKFGLQPYVLKVEDDSGALHEVA